MIENQITPEQIERLKPYIGQELSYAKICKIIHAEMKTGSSKTRLIKNINEYIEFDKIKTHYLLKRFRDEKITIRGKSKVHGTWAFESDIAIYTTKSGESTTVDIDDYERLKDFTISFSRGYFKVYNADIESRSERKQLHRFIVDCYDPNMVVHHINGDKSDNRKSNLKAMTKEEHIEIHKNQGDLFKRGKYFEYNEKDRLYLKNKKNSQKYIIEGYEELGQFTKADFKRFIKALKDNLKPINWWINKKEATPPFLLT